MSTSLTHFLERRKADGSLAISSNLLFDAVLLGWLAFALLYSIEVLLPTFVTARLSLVKFSFLLIGLTTLLAALGKIIPDQKKTNGAPSGFERWICHTTLIFVLSTLAIAHYRFPWWTIPLSVGIYSIIGYLLWKHPLAE